MTHKSSIVCYRIIVHANAINELSFTNITFFSQCPNKYLKSKLTRRPLYKQFALYMLCLYLKSQNENSYLAFCFRYGASMIAGLVSYHDWVGVQIVEDTLEHVRIGNLFISKINFDVLLFFFSFFKKNRI